ncbi:MAG: M1 family aminopeptidase [Planctomycetota bacterium]
MPGRPAEGLGFACRMSRGDGFTTPGSEPSYAPDLALEPVHIEVRLLFDLEAATASGSVVTTVRSNRDDARSLRLDGVSLGDLSASDPYGELLRWLTERLGRPFPLRKYYQIALPEIGGAMENISLVTWDDLAVLDEEHAREWGHVVDTINIHEMAHACFGDTIVCRHFEHSWLKESWATYIETVWLEETRGGEGRDERDHDLYCSAQRYFREARERYVRPIVTREYSSSWDLFDMHLHPGGALLGAAGVLSGRDFEELRARIPYGAERDPVRPTAVEAFGRLAPRLEKERRDLARDLLVDLTRDPRERVRRKSGAAVAGLADASAIPALEALKAREPTQDTPTIERWVRRIRKGSEGEQLPALRSQVEKLEERCRKLEERLGTIEARGDAREDAHG